MKVYAHSPYIGTTGYNNHTRNFFRKLKNHCELKVRNFTVGKSWDGYSKTPHDNEPYLNDIDKEILYQQTLLEGDKRVDYPIYSHKETPFKHDVNLILCETNHHYFYDSYVGPTIAYNVWESTIQPEEFFKKLQEFDMLWVPSEWQKQCTIEQGYDPNKISVVPEGVDVDVFYPKKEPILNEKFRFVLVGRWDYRKSTKEIIESFIETFKDNDNVELVVSIDNPWGEEMDGFKTTEERLRHYSLIDDKVIVKSFLTGEEYVELIRTANVFVSCSRSEGWNLPLIEAMASGIPSIYSNCSGQLEFAEGHGLPVNILSERPAKDNTYARFAPVDIIGNYYEPDFTHLGMQMKDALNNYEKHKDKAVNVTAPHIHENFNWDKVGEIGYEKLLEFNEMTKSPDFQKSIPENKIHITFVNGPKVEITGQKYKDYFVEFIADGKVEHSGTIQNNMWIQCDIKYYKNWIIRINGDLEYQMDLTGQRVLIALESKSIGDTIAWAPYAVKFAKKHNCKVILSTFHNEWFKNLPEYKDVEFLEPGGETNCYSRYIIGWMRNDDGKLNKFDYYPTPPNTKPLQQTATDILGMEYQELNLGIDFRPTKKPPIKQPYIIVSPESTAGCKEWPMDSWSHLAKMLKTLGYRVISLTLHPRDIENVENIYGLTIKTCLNYFHHADAFVGLSSGQSWLNWAIGKHTIMISGFTEKDHEFGTNITRIQNEHACNSCWSNTNFVFDPGDWDWCPIWKGTDKQHICQKSISPLTVYNKLIEILN